MRDLLGGITIVGGRTQPVHRDAVQAWKPRMATQFTEILNTHLKVWRISVM